MDQMSDDDLLSEDGKSSISADLYAEEIELDQLTNWKHASGSNSEGLPYSEEPLAGKTNGFRNVNGKENIAKTKNRSWKPDESHCTQQLASLWYWPLSWRQHLTFLLTIKTTTRSKDKRAGGYFVFRCKHGNGRVELLQTCRERQCCQELKGYMESLPSNLVLRELESLPSCVTKHMGLSDVCLNRWSQRS